MLQIKKVYASYGSNMVLRGVSLEVMPGEIVALLGRNGVGKSTVLRSVLGLVTVHSGAIEFNGRDITKMSIHERARLGISYIPDNKGIFTSLTTHENLQVAQIGSKRSDSDIEWIMELFPILKERRKQIAGSLSGGEQQILSIARGMVVKPKLLVLDEITEGLAPEVITDMLKVFGQFCEEGMGILMAEQNVNISLSISHRVYAILGGEIVFGGTVHEAHENRVVDKYIKL